MALETAMSPSHYDITRCILVHKWQKIVSIHPKSTFLTFISRVLRGDAPWEFYKWQRMKRLANAYLPGVCLPQEFFYRLKFENWPKISLLLLMSSASLGRIAPKFSMWCVLVRAWQFGFKSSVLPPKSLEVKNLDVNFTQASIHCNKILSIAKRHCKRQCFPHITTYILIYFDAQMAKNRTVVLT